MELQRAIVKAMPDHNDMLLRHEAGYPPQLTLGQCDKETVEETTKKLEASFTPIQFTVSEIHLISRDGDAPFEVRYSLPLGQGKLSGEFAENPVTFNTARRLNTDRRYGAGSEANRGLRQDFREGSEQAGAAGAGYFRRPRQSGAVESGRQFERRPREQSDRPKLFVSNLSWNIDNNMLLSLFKEQGAVRAYIIMDRVKERSRGYGFVEFDTEAQQAAACQTMNGKEFDGRQIVVKLAAAAAAGGGGGGAGADGSDNGTGQAPPA